MTEASDPEKIFHPKVITVIPTWNDTALTSRCISSLATTTYPNLHVLLVDNGSQPECAASLKEKHPEIETLRLDKNYGFTGGCNRGIEAALNQNADYIFLLNNDTIVHEDAVQHLVDTMEAHPKAGLASALLLYPGEERKVQFYRGFVERNIARHYHPQDQQHWTPEFQETVQTEFAPACALLYRPQTLIEVGLFDESLFTNWEDYDLHLRIADAGWDLYTVGKAEVIHAHGQTQGRISPFVTYFVTRNRFICLFRFGTPPGILFGLPRFARTLWWQMKEYKLNNWGAHAALLKGILHYFMGVRGENGAPGKRSD